MIGLELFESCKTKVTCRQCTRELDKPSRCGKCKTVYYCDRICQRANHNRHKVDCQLVKARQGGYVLDEEFQNSPQAAKSKDALCQLYMLNPQIDRNERFVMLDFEKKCGLMMILHDWAQLLRLKPYYKSNHIYLVIPLLPFGKLLLQAIQKVHSQVLYADALLESDQSATVEAYDDGKLKVRGALITWDKSKADDDSTAGSST